MIEPRLSALRIADKEGILKRWPHELGHTAVVEVNPDDFMPPYFKFELTSSKPILPPHIVIYGKGNGLDDALYVNFWLPIFAKTVEKGGLEYYQPERWGTDILCIGLPCEFRRVHIAYNIARVMDFTTALFGGKACGVKVVETEDLREQLPQAFDRLCGRLSRRDESDDEPYEDDDEWD